MIVKELTVSNDAGIHARPAALIVERVCKFKCEVHFHKDGMRANAKSIMNIMLLAAEPGAVIRVEADGVDEVEAMEMVEKLFKNDFEYDDK